MTEEEVLVLLKARCVGWGSQARLADAAGISRQHISDIVRGHRHVNQRVAQVLGLRRVVEIRYEPVDGGNE